jgi:hypothetical protein
VYEYWIGVYQDPQLADHSSFWLLLLDWTSKVNMSCHVIKTTNFVTPLVLGFCSVGVNLKSARSRCDLSVHDWWGGVKFNFVIGSWPIFTVYLVFFQVFVILNEILQFPGSFLQLDCTLQSLSYLKFSLYTDNFKRHQIITAINQMCLKFFCLLSRVHDHIYCQQIHSIMKASKVVLGTWMVLGTSVVLGTISKYTFT